MKRMSITTEPQTKVPPLREIRQAQGLTLYEVSKRTGIDSGQLSRMERGLQGISLPTLYKLTEELGPRQLTRLLKPYIGTRAAI